MNRRLVVALVSAAVVLPLAVVAGCNVVGYVAAVTFPDQNPPPARYEDLKNQTCGLMVWAPRQIRSDFPMLRLDLGNSLQKTLVDVGQQQLKQPELVGMRFPYQADSYIRFMDEHPELEGQPITQVALRPNVPGLSRLIYIEVERFETRSEQSRDLYHGFMQASLRVVEIQGGQARVAFEEPGIQIHYPPKDKNGRPLSEAYNDKRMYDGLVEQFGGVVAQRFFEPKGE